MKPQELRIGNHVNYLGNPTIITAIQSTSEGPGIVSTPKSGAVTINSIEPIPLTEELLLKAGFDNRGMDTLYSIGKFVIFKFGAVFMLMQVYSNGELSKTDIFINSLHHLQNLYFALKGEELSINL